MRSDLMLYKYHTEKSSGTKNMTEIPSFFGSKIMKLEKEIIIDETIYDYYDIPDINKDGEPFINKGFQSKVKTDKETLKTNDMSAVKSNFKTITLSTQNDLDLKFNTKWDIDVNIERILSEYLFSNIKKYRVFSSLKTKDLLTKNINNSIREYINENLLGRYKFKQINFYVKYYDIIDTGSEVNTKLQYNPIFNKSIKDDSNLVVNINSIKKSANLKTETLFVKYTQTKSSENYMFEYYYDIVFDLI